MLNQRKNRKVGAILALTGIISPISGLHKFYLGQPLWGMLYLMLSWTPIPHVASAIEGVWYLAQDGDEFDRNFNADALGKDSIRGSAVDTNRVSAIAQSLRELDDLRRDGLISEYEFEQKRRCLLDRIV